MGIQEPLTAQERFDELWAVGQGEHNGLVEFQETVVEQKPVNYVRTVIRRISAAGEIGSALSVSNFDVTFTAGDPAVHQRLSVLEALVVLDLSHE